MQRGAAGTRAAGVAAAFRLPPTLHHSHPLPQLPQLGRPTEDGPP